MSTSYIPVTNLKLATMLASFGVPLVPPTVTRVRVKNKRGGFNEVVGYFFKTTSVTGLDATKLIAAWEKPELFENSTEEPFCHIPMLRAVLDNNDAWRAAT